MNTELEGDRRRPTRRGTKVHFKPDPEIFETVDFNCDTLSQRLRELAFLNKGIRIEFADERTGKKHDFQYEGGIVSFVKYLNENKTVLHPAPIYHAREKDRVIVEIAIQYNDGYAENVFSFVNNINTIEGGTHLIGFRAGAHPHAQQLRRARRDAEGAEGRHARRRRRARGADRGHQREDPRARSSKGRPRPSSGTAR